MNRILKRIKEIKETPLLAPFFFCDSLRRNIRLIGSVLINSFSVVINGIFVVIYQDGILASAFIYYLVLLALRIFLFRADKKHKSINKVRTAAYLVGVCVLGFCVLVTLNIFVYNRIIPVRYNVSVPVAQGAFFITYFLIMLFRIHRPEHNDLLTLSVDSLSFSTALYSAFNFLSCLLVSFPFPFGAQLLLFSEIGVVALLIYISFLLFYKAKKL